VKRDGFGVNVTTGRELADINSYSARASLLWEPTDRIRNDLIGSTFATSKYTAGVNVTMTPVDTPETGKVTFSGNYSYRSRFTTDQSLPYLEPESFAPAQHNVNLALDWEQIMGSQASAQAWVRNAHQRAHYSRLHRIGAFLWCHSRHPG
jgi:hypothetical protein